MASEASSALDLPVGSRLWSTAGEDAAVKETWDRKQARKRAKERSPHSGSWPLNMATVVQSVVHATKIL